jgi:hypothetical protein
LFCFHTYRKDLHPASVSSNWSTGEIKRKFLLPYAVSTFRNFSGHWVLANLAGNLQRRRGAC